MFFNRFFVAIGCMTLSYVISVISLNISKSIEKTGRFQFLLKFFIFIHFIFGMASLFVGFFFSYTLQFEKDSAVINLKKEHEEKETSLQSQIESLSADNADLRLRLFREEQQYAINCRSKPVKKPISYESAAASLAGELADLLHLPNDQLELLKSFVVGFIRSISNFHELRLKDIDEFIDHLYLKGFTVPGFDQYHRYGMNVILTSRVYVPEEVRNVFPDWLSFRSRALSSCLLLTDNNSAPTIDSWNAELSAFLPEFFSNDSAFASNDVILERIVQISEEALDDRASLPEHICRFCDIDHPHEYDLLKTLDSEIDKALRSFAHSVNMHVEDLPTDSIGLLNRVSKHKDRFKLIINYRSEQLLSWESSFIVNEEQ